MFILFSKILGLQKLKKIFFPICYSNKYCMREIKKIALLLFIVLTKIVSVNGATADYTTSCTTIDSITVARFVAVECLQNRYLIDLQRTEIDYLIKKTKIETTEQKGLLLIANHEMKEARKQRNIFFITSIIFLVLNFQR
jgi:hypothetical protein